MCATTQTWTRQAESALFVSLLDVHARERKPVGLPTCPAPTPEASTRAVLLAPSCARLARCTRPDAACTVPPVHPSTPPAPAPSRLRPPARAQVLPTALRGAFQSCGQNCAGAERFLVQDSVFDEFVR